MSDEHPVFMTGCYGHRSARTPASEERRLAILKALGGQEPSGGQVPSPALPHPLRDQERMGG